MNLRDFFDASPVARVDTTIGELCVFWLDSRAHEVLFTQEGIELAANDPASFLRQVVRYSSAPANSLREGKYKPETPVLDEAALGKLVEADLARFASAYLEHYEDLYKHRVEKRSRDKEGTPVISWEYEGIKNPRTDGESDVHYLVRLLVLEHEAQKKAAAEHLERIMKSFSGGLAGEIQRMRSAGEILTDSVNQFRGIDVSETVRHVEHFNVVQAQIEAQRAAHERPFERLGKRLDRLIQHTVQSVNFTVRAHEVQTEIAAELKAAGDENKKVAATNLRLTWFVIWITVAGLLLSFGVGIAQIWQASAFDKAGQQATEANIERLVEELRGLQSALSAGQAEQRRAEQALRDEVIRLKGLADDRVGEMEELKQTIQKQARELEALKGRE